MNEEKNRLLEDLYQKYYDAVFRWCFQEIHFQACYIPLIEDCIHDAFRKAIVCYEEYKDYMNPMGWIAKAARNCFLSELRKQKNRSSQASLKKIVTEQAMSRDLYLSDFERWLEQEECKEKLDAILAILTDQERIIFDAYFRDDLSVSQTVEQTGLSDGAVKATIARIRKKARQIFHFVMFIFSQWFFFLFSCTK